MATRRLNVEIPIEVFDHFKEECAKNHVLMKDEVFKYICAALDGVAATETKKAASPSFLGSTKIRLSGEPLDDSFEKELAAPVTEDLDAKMKPILGMIEGLTSVTKDLQQWREGFRVWQDGKFDALDASVLAFDGKMKIVSNFFENNIYFQMTQHGANPCTDDIQGLALLRNKEVPSKTYLDGLTKEQRKEVFLKQMETKAF